MVRWLARHELVETKSWVAHGDAVHAALRRTCHAVAALTGSEDGTGTLTAGVFFVLTDTVHAGARASEGSRTLATHGHGKKMLGAID